MDEYTHVVIDKNNVGLDVLRQRIRERGILTAEASGYQLAAGSIKLEHHLHVFLWDSTLAGQKGRMKIIVGSALNTTFTVRVRCPHFTKDGIFFSGTLQGDNGHNGPPKGISTNGAWGYKGNIESRFCFIEGLHTRDTPGYEGWERGDGWP
ncbi:hypothetical protein [Microbulbifer spongiae]|uniref:Uncharacterized protein n=1 Tax=Microbulbifer spongiae TaxID=2944933 RepID=A0ABY9EC42_9GAMM|nr:hypothetical protein [Microbulbifer sp. MI-G]WKD49531.1 hypothetical protein M8T91_16800 [Microbulbifer sp. MI-G]